VSHQPEDIRLRPSGVANPKDVKLYPWAVSGNLEITEVETGHGADSVRVTKLLIILDSGTGSDTVAKAKPSAFTIADSGCGANLIHTVKTLPKLRNLEAELSTTLWSLKLPTRLRAILRVHSTIIDEGRLSVSGEPDRLQGGYIYPYGGIDNLRAVKASSDSDIQPRTVSSQKTPRGYYQGHRSWAVELYTLGRSSVLDALSDEDGESTEFDVLDIRCLDVEGYFSNIFAEECVIAGVEAVHEDSQDAIYHYSIRCGRFGRTPLMRVLKMTMKPVSAPLTIELIHPILYPVSATPNWILEHDREPVISATALPDYIPYEGMVWLIIAEPKTGGTLSFSGWEAIRLEDSKQITAVADTASSYVIYNSTSFVLDDESSLGEVSEAGIASCTVPPQDGNSSHYVYCRFALGWGVTAYNTTNDGYVRANSGSGISSQAWESVYEPHSGWRVAWYIDGQFIGFGSKSPYIPAKPDGTYHVLTNSLVMG
jgi:hypothetical protein